MLVYGLERMVACKNILLILVIFGSMVSRNSATGSTAPKTEFDDKVFPILTGSYDAITKNLGFFRSYLIPFYQSN